MTGRPQLTESIREAFEWARRGQIQRAEALCNEILRSESEQSDALLLRAAIEVQTGRMSEAAESARRSLRKDPSRAAAHALLGDALSNLNRPGEALQCYEAALRLEGSLLSAQHGRGNALLDLRRPLEALANYDHILERQPNDAEAHCKRGNALFGLGQFEPAAASYGEAIRLRPSYVQAFNNRGAALMSSNLNDAALASFEAAVAIDPAFAEAHHNRGLALRRLERLRESLEAFDAALRLRPGHVEALCGRAEALRDLKRPDQALAGFERALALRPGDAGALRGRGDALLDLDRPHESLAEHDAAVRADPGISDSHNSRGNSLRVLGRMSEAVRCYEEAIRLNSANAAAHYNRGTALLQAGLGFEANLSSYARVLELNPDFDYVAGAFLNAQQNMADWTVRIAAASAQPICRAVAAGKPSAAPFHFLSICDDAAAQLRCAITYTARRFPGGEARWSGPPHRHDRIRIAYVSPDFRQHAVSYLMAGIFERHDPRRFDTIGISLKPEDGSPLGQRVKRAFNRFIDVSDRGDGEVTELLRGMEIDIAVDLCGYTDGFRPRIFRNRAAPIQVNYLGYPGTLGAPFMDYLLADSFVIPPQQRSNYSEQVVYLPGCFQAGEDRRLIADHAAERNELGMPRDAFVFCCLNNSYKINSTMFDIWMRLLGRVRGSILWLVGGREAVRENLRREAASRGIDPDRLVFTARASYAQYLGRLRAADLFLDTLPFNAGATASDALGSGLPLLTCAGKSFASRMAGSLLLSLGLPELISADLAQYEAKALQLAQQPERLRAIRLHLDEAQRDAPSFDTGGFCGGLESAYERMWQRHRRGEEPAAFSVPAADGGR